MGYYQGRALREGTRPRTRIGPIRRILHVMGALGVVVILIHVPWASLRGRLAQVREIRVEGLHYLDAERVAALAGLSRGQDLFTVDCAKARQALLLNPRIERAEVSRQWPPGVHVQVTERVPALLIRHGLPWEMDSSGVLLAPLAPGAVADVPLLAGVSFERFPEGTEVRTPEVLRGLAWIRALGTSDLQLTGQVSEIDVSDPHTTGLLLMNGTRVLSPAWPPENRTLSALRVVLADLEHRGLLAQEVDLRFRDQVIVRPATPAAGEPLGSTPGNPSGNSAGMHMSVSLGAPGDRTTGDR